MFSEAISSISWRCRPSSPRIAADISGSASASVAVKNESGAEAVLAELAGGFIGEYLHRRSLLEAHGRSCVAVESGARGIAYPTAMAKLLRLPPDIYARCGGIPRFAGPRTQ